MPLHELQAPPSFVRDDYPAASDEPEPINLDAPETPAASPNKPKKTSSLTEVTNYRWEVGRYAGNTTDDSNWYMPNTAIHKDNAGSMILTEQTAIESRSMRGWSIAIGRTGRDRDENAEIACLVPEELVAFRRYSSLREIVCNRQARLASMWTTMETALEGMQMDTDEIQAYLDVLRSVILKAGTDFSAIFPFQ
jgi:hypothetical protein